MQVRAEYFCMADVRWFQCATVLPWAWCNTQICLMPVDIVRLVETALDEALRVARVIGPRHLILPWCSVRLGFNIRAACSQ